MLKNIFKYEKKCEGIKISLSLKRSIKHKSYLKLFKMQNLFYFK